MLFKEIATGIVSATPPALHLMHGTGSFIVVLNVADYQFPTFTQWDLQYKISVDGITYGGWNYLTTVSGDFNSYNYTNVDITKFYHLRYQLKSRTETSIFSPSLVAGKPIVIIATGQPHTTPISGYVLGQYS